MSLRRPTMLMILDGWGWGEDRQDNAVRQARTPNFDRLWETCPHAFLRTSGLDVGLPEGQMGNSEVGHLNLGAGRVVMQDLPRINEAIRDGSIAAFLERTGLIEKLRESGGTCHLLGLISPGGVHSHQDHAVALAKILAREGIPAVLHVFTDGRDTPPRSGAEYVRELEAALPKEVPIATVCGRYFAMDRDRRWERVKEAFDALVHGKAVRYPDAQSAIAAGYAQDKTDEFLPPAVIGGYEGMRSGDGILSFNFRADRIRQLLDALLDEASDSFERGDVPHFAAAAGMTSYSADLDTRMKALFPPQTLANGLGETVAKAGRRQLRMAETEKYPHVTYFLNGGEETPYSGEDRIMVPSPKVATYDLQPEMSAPELTAKAVEAIRSGNYDLLVLNFANPDMVGHTGVLAAAVKAVETVDASLGQIAEAIREAGGSLLVTADHGNCEQMLDPATGGPHTAHTTNPVPVFLLSEQPRTLGDGRLADVAPTLLELMGLPQPQEMTGHSLLRRG
ncbi:2,3-bisphosphoglycerate-independent phosphoglycerate mutase [Microvirga sp. 2TAF3]|uniref:2,3-bisphosphoglycerate-independent phosphoglycerate mutase n=1 Tax=Microvirga sp. 2TAF3 TaxID=3233014 RepID=UPI003F9C04EB